jgi:hypothetical protein
MVKYGVLFEVRTEFLNIIYTSFGFKDLNENGNDLSRPVFCHKIQLLCIFSIKLFSLSHGEQTET